MDPAPCSRLAPSPTGPLHLGNACTFLVNWALARNAGWRLVLRIEDLDRDRARAAGEARIARTTVTLHRLGLSPARFANVQGGMGGPYEPISDSAGTNGATTGTTEVAARADEERDGVGAPCVGGRGRPAVRCGQRREKHARLDAHGEEGEDGRARRGVVVDRHGAGWTCFPA